MKKFAFVAQLAICVLTAFGLVNAQEDKDADAGDLVLRVVKDPNGADYFPEGKESYYTKYYRAAGLPSMMHKREPKGHIRFRLGIIPSFTKPLFLTYSDNGENGLIEVRRLSLKRINNQVRPNLVELTGEIVVGPNQAKNLETEVMMPSVRQPLRKLNDKMRELLQPLDACVWILEVSTDKDYTMEDVNNPEWLGNFESLHPDAAKEHKVPKIDTAPFIEFCDSLLSAVELKASEHGAPE